ncbi:hypothetical protein H8B06_16215 [Sphingobacterium sp. DN00404]|uniref:Uncharacterized protein n=1 Tax=Sphingobacterium micropteri TaxID=2763501 RepID=A0ABR7YSQ6_9SPHI|nr:hypothetical protein [Sphingobacterium micropteri]MBD1434378.1 hypothetical protein [Sphingobacterium micropteri]
MWGLQQQTYGAGKAQNKHWKTVDRVLTGGFRWIDRMLTGFAFQGDRNHWYRVHFRFE